MKIRSTPAPLKAACDILARKSVGVLKEELENFLGLLIQSANFWSELLNLRFQICLIKLKLRYTLRKQRNLLKRVSELTVQNSELIMRQRDALVLHRSRCDVTDDSLNGVEHIGCGTLPLANVES